MAALLSVVHRPILFVVRIILNLGEVTLICEIKANILTIEEQNQDRGQVFLKSIIYNGKLAISHCQNLNCLMSTENCQMKAMFGFLFRRNNLLNIKNDFALQNFDKSTQFLLEYSNFIEKILILYGVIFF